jgi:hypothetical protein
MATPPAIFSVTAPLGCSAYVVVSDWWLCRSICRALGYGLRLPIGDCVVGVSGPGSGYVVLVATTSTMTENGARIVHLLTDRTPRPWACR